MNNKKNQKIELQQEYIFDNKDVNVSLPKFELSDVDDLKYLFEKYLITVKRNKPNQKAANLLKTMIDVTQVKSFIK